MFKSLSLSKTKLPNFTGEEKKIALLILYPLIIIQEIVGLRFQNKSWPIFAFHGQRQDYFLDDPGSIGEPSVTGPDLPPLGRGQSFFSDFPVGSLGYRWYSIIRNKQGRFWVPTTLTVCILFIFHFAEIQNSSS